MIELSRRVYPRLRAPRLVGIQPILDTRLFLDYMQFKDREKKEKSYNGNRKAYKHGL